MWGDAIRRYQVAVRQARSRDDRLIRSREAVVRQLIRRHPHQRLAFRPVGFTGKRLHLPDIEQHLLVRIIVAHLDQRLRRGNDDAQLLQQLTRQRRLDALISLDLAAGKFPQSSLVFVERTLCDKHARVGATNDGCGYMDSFHFRTSCRAL